MTHFEIMQWADFQDIKNKRQQDRAEAEGDS